MLLDIESHDHEGAPWTLSLPMPVKLVGDPNSDKSDTHIIPNR